MVLTEEECVLDLFSASFKRWSLKKANTKTVNRVSLQTPLTEGNCNGSEKVIHRTDSDLFGSDGLQIKATTYEERQQTTITAFQGIFLFGRVWWS